MYCDNDNFTWRTATPAESFVECTTCITNLKVLAMMALHVLDLQCDVLPGVMDLHTCR